MTITPIPRQAPQQIAVTGDSLVLNDLTFHPAEAAAIARRYLADHGAARRPGRPDPQVPTGRTTRPDRRCGRSRHRRDPVRTR